MALRTVPGSRNSMPLPLRRAARQHCAVRPSFLLPGAHHCRRSVVVAMTRVVVQALRQALRNPRRCHGLLLLRLRCRVCEKRRRNLADIVCSSPGRVPSPAVPKASCRTSDMADSSLAEQATLQRRRARRILSRTAWLRRFGRRACQAVGVHTAAADRLRGSERFT